jgi:hypothetical protein
MLWLGLGPGDLNMGNIGSTLGHGDRQLGNLEGAVDWRT